MTDRVHTIAVPPGWSPEQAWESMMHEWPEEVPWTEEECSWANILERDGKLVAVLEDD
jgi:hypothetical protein